MKTLILRVLVVWLALGAMTMAAPPELRTWTAQSGAQVKARLIEQKDANVILENANGERFEIGLDKLSPQDQKYIQGLPKAAAPAAAAPAASGPLAVDPEGKWKAGTVSDEIECKKNSQWTYLLYVPKAYDPKQKWPVLFVAAHSGATPADLKLFVPGAETCGWIVAFSEQARTQSEDSDTAVRAMVNDVLARFPIDQKRMYGAGYIDGAAYAVNLAGQHKDPPLAGLLLINGNQADVRKVPSETVAYGLCGCNCGCRGAMIRMFHELHGDNDHLRFFAGQNNWPSPELIRDGMMWLHYAGLQAATLMDQELLKERKAFAKKMQDEINHLKDTDPERAAEWTEALLGPGGMENPMALLNPQLSALLKNPRTKLYLDGQKDLSRLLRRYFPPPNTGNDLGKEGDAEARKLANTYKDCSLGDVFTGLTQVTVAIPRD